MHAKDKPIPREGDSVWESDALLHRVGELTIGYAGADLANLLNEAAILMVHSIAYNAQAWLSFPTSMILNRTLPACAWQQSIYTCGHVLCISDEACLEIDDLSNVAAS